MKSISVRLAPEDRDAFLGQLLQSNTTGVLEEDEVLTAYFDDETDLSAFRTAFGYALVNSPPIQTMPDTPANLQSWDPVIIGERFFIAPSWIEDPTPPGRHRVVLDAQGAFGSGRHESTQLMMRAMERVLSEGDTVLDVGCGSGILSAAAESMNAQTILGCDISPEAIEIARRHTSRSSFFLGSADSICTGSADLILVNITAAACDALAPELARVIKPRGWLVLSGFVREKVPEAYKADQILEQNGWLCWICSPQSVRVDGHCQHLLQPFPLQWW